MPTPQFGSKPEHLAKIRLAVEAKEKYGDFSAAERATGIDNSTLLRWYKHRDLLNSGLVAPAPLGHSVKGVSTLHKPDGSIAQQWIKTRNEPTPEETAEVIKAALAGIQSYAKLPPPPKSPDKDLATLIALPDLHIGMLAYRGETISQEDWDTSIAEKQLRTMAEDLINATPNSNMGVVLSLGDLLHFDGYEPATSRSRNILDTDSRYPRVLEAAVKYLVFVTDLSLQRYSEVLVRILPGNHDDQSAIAVAMALRMFYHDNPRVTVDTDGSRWWFWRWGKTFIGATHGDMAKMADIAKTMAAVRPEDWGASKFRYGLSGHIHRRSKAADDIMGVQSESFATPIPRDFWADSMGYTPQRNLNAITYHRERGEVSRNRVSL